MQNHIIPVRVIIFLGLGLLSLFSSFSINTTTKIQYDYMHFIRLGGGQIDFNLYQTDNLDRLNAIVQRVNFHDTSLQAITIERNSENDYAFEAFNKAMLGQYELAGDFDNKRLLTGTWPSFYFVTNGIEVEVKNKELHDKLLYFEKVVQEIVRVEE